MGKKIAALSDEEFAAWLAERDRKDQEALAQDYHYGTRKVSPDGRITCWGKHYRIGRQFAGRRVFFKEYVDRLVFEIEDVHKEFSHVRAPLEEVVPRRELDNATGILRNEKLDK